MQFLKTLFHQIFAITIFLLAAIGHAQDSVEIPIIEVQEAEPHEAQMDTLDSSNEKKDVVAPTSDSYFIPPDYGTPQSEYTVKTVPNPKKNGGNGYISDPNDYLSLKEENLINTLINGIEHKTTAQIAVVMVESIGDEVPKDFAVDLFDEWGIGQADRDNGLLILSVMDQRRTEFEVGYGLEPILTDVVCFRIGMSEIVPNFRQGNYGTGIVAAIGRIEQILDNPEVIDEIYSSGLEYEEESKGLPGFVIFLLFYGSIAAVVSLWKYGIAFDIERSKDDYYDKYQRLKKHKIGCLTFLFPIPLLFFSKMLGRRLKRYRTSPRFSKKNGKPLHLKNEWAENEFLEEAQMLEEKLDSVLYDVWTTEDKSDILILAYEGSSRKYTRCKKCSYKTYGRESSKILKYATYKHSGEKLTYYHCRNCNFRDEVTETIPKKVRSSSSSGSSGSSFGGSSSSSFGGGRSGGGGSGVSW